MSLVMIAVHHRRTLEASMSPSVPSVKDLEHVATLELEADVVEDALDEAFALTNSIEKPWYKAQVDGLVVTDLVRSRNGQRSTSVGDVFEVAYFDEKHEPRSKWVIVKCVGFDAINKPF